MFIANLAGSGQFIGRVVHGKIDQEYGGPEDPVVLVLPNGNVQYFNTMVYTARKCGGKLAVVVERGGPSCHLAINVREKHNIALVMLPNALDLLPEGAEVLVDLKHHEITVF